MKLLTEVMEHEELTRIRILFDSKGIPVFIGNEDSARNFGFIYPARKYSIFVIYEEQYQEALSLLDNDTYEVQNPVDPDEHQKLIETNSKNSFNKLFKVITIIGAVLFISIAILIIISVNT